MIELIRHYYQCRGLKVPDARDAIQWTITELGEAIDLLMMKPGSGWIRNHPKEPWSRKRFGEELGDAIMMLLMAGYAEGVDPLEELTTKIDRKLREI